MSPEIKEIIDMGSLCQHGTRSLTYSRHFQSEEVQEFLEAILIVGHKYGLSLSHEDIGGSFIVRDFNVKDARWLLGSDDYTGAG